MKCASVNRTLFRPLSLRKQIARSSCDSGLAIVHVVGGAKNRSQFRQNETEACLGIPSVISMVFLRQATHKFAEFGVIGVPQSAQSTLCTGGGAANSMVEEVESKL